MPKAYSEDLWWRILWTYLYRELSIEEISSFFYVSKKTIDRIVQRYFAEGEICGKTQGDYGKRNQKLTENEQVLLLQIIFDYPGIYLDEIQQRMASCTGKMLHISNICRLVKKMGLTRQRIRHIVIKRSEEDRASFMNLVEEIPASCFIWIDETGSDRRSCNRSVGYGLRGLTPVSVKLSVGGKRISAITCMSTRGIEDFYLVEGGVNGDVFVNLLNVALNL